VFVSRVPGLVRTRKPVEVEEEVGLRGYFPTGYQGCTMQRECGDRLREAGCGWVYLRGGADEPQAGKAALVAY